MRGLGTCDPGSIPATYLLVRANRYFKDLSTYGENIKSATSKCAEVGKVIPICSFFRMGLSCDLPHPRMAPTNRSVGIIKRKVGRHSTGNGGTDNANNLAIG